MSQAPRLNRRSFVHRVLGAALGAGAAVGAGQGAYAITDSDPTDRAYQGGGCVADSDPTDRARCGGAGAGTRPIGFVLLIAGVGAAAAGTYMRRKRD